MKHCTTSLKIADSVPGGVIDLFLPAALWHWGSSLGYLLRGDAEKGLQPYHLHVPIAWKLGRFFLLEASGHVQR